MLINCWKLIKISLLAYDYFIYQITDFLGDINVLLMEFFRNPLIDCK